VEKHVLLRAIFFLEQTSSDAVSALGRGNAAVLINQSATQVLRRAWDRMDADTACVSKNRVFQTAGNLSREIPAYMLSVSREGRFWEMIDKVLMDI
jgi:SynChlorMet cassette protein ScmC